MEREHRSGVATFFAPGEWSARVTLPDGAAHHARVKRMVPGDGVRLTSGDGRRVDGTIARLGKQEVTVEIDPASIECAPALPRLVLYVPVGDRDRMLLLAEKAVELGVSEWRPVVFARSRSVSPRGEGAAFHAKVSARQVGALEQSGSAWLPLMHPEVPFEALLDVATSDGDLLLLDPAGVRLHTASVSADRPVFVSLGPEGGLETGERDALLAHGWRPVAVGANILRFETAAIAAIAIVNGSLR